MKPPIVFVHGAFCGGWAFEEFKTPFIERGYAAYTPNLPDHENGADLARLSRHGVRDYADALAHYCKRLSGPPILIGHSLGGLVCQIAATRMDAAAVVLLAPSAPWGVMPTTLDEHGSHLGLSLLGDYWRRPVHPEYSVARHTSLDRLDSRIARHTFARFVPESGRAVLETMQWWLDPSMSSAAPPHRTKSPLLAIAGSRDKVNPPSTVRSIVSRFPHGQAEFQEATGLSHWLIGEPEWTSVAETALNWLERVGAVGTSKRRTRSTVAKQSPSG